MLFLDWQIMDVFFPKLAGFLFCMLPLHQVILLTDFYWKHIVQLSYAFMKLIFIDRLNITTMIFYEWTSVNVFWYSINILRKMGYQRADRPQGFLKYRDNLKKWKNSDKNNILTTLQLRIRDKIQDTFFLYTNAKAMLWRPTATS